MREIKFRAWNISDTGNTDSMSKWDYLAEYPMEQIIEAYPETLMQFTGLEDKNGKEIFEGDIVKLSDNVIHEGILVICNWYEDAVRFLYKFLTGENKGKCTDMVDDWRKYEVIGNKFENPELLEDKNERI